MKNNKKTVVYLGSLEPHKGFKTVVKSVPLVVKKRPDINFLFVSPGKRNFLSDKNYEFNKLFIDDYLTSFKSNYKIIEKIVSKDDLMNHVDLVVVPQLTASGTLVPPLTILEAMFYGKPVIVSNTEGIQNFISNNKNGLLVKPGDEIALSNAILKLFDNKILYNRLKNNGFECVKNLNIKSTSKRFFEFLLKAKKT